MGRWGHLCLSTCLFCCYIAICRLVCTASQVHSLYFIQQSKSPAPLLEASTSTMNCRSGWRWFRIGAVVNCHFKASKAFWASGFHLIILGFPLRRDINRATTVQAPNEAVNVGKTQETFHLFAFDSFGLGPGGYCLHWSMPTPLCLRM